MLKYLLRIAMFIAGTVFLLDAVLPLGAGPARVDRHYTTTGNNPADRNSIVETTYTLQFAGGRAHTCSVGRSAYTALQDGDEVVLATTRLLNHCIRIHRAGERLYEAKYSRIFQAIFSLLLLAAALGLMRNGEEVEFSFEP